MIQLAKSIWMILTLDCQGSAELTSQSFDRKLHWSENLAVKLHCMICSKSRRLNRQLRLMDQKLNQTFAENVESIKLSDVAKARMSKRLQEARGS